MIKRIPIRAKLALALFLPVLAMFAVSTYEIGEASREVDQVREDTDLAGAALGPGGLIRSLQDERNDSAISAVGLRASAQLPTEDLAASRQATDEAAVAFRASLADSGPKAAAVYRPALEAFDDAIVDLRTSYDDAPGEPGLGRLPLSNELWAGYSEPIEAFVAANTRLTLLVEDPELRNAAEMLDVLSRQFEDLGTMVRTGIISSLGGVDVEGTTKNDVIRAINRFEANEARITLLADGPYAAEAAALQDNQAYQDAIELLEGYVATSELDTAGIIAAVSARPAPNLDTVAAATTTALQDRSAELRSDATDRQRTFIALAVGVLVVGGAFMLAAARSITRPLRSLTRQAEDMATTRLPAAVQEILDTPLGDDVVIPDVEPVAVKTRDEVRDVVVALNSVQASAIDLAVEQAVLRRNIADSFVNLGRRTQNLIGRQLAFISELERNETDPATLNDLFELDHLATRARRNAESLVVLAGLATPRTWTAPIAMGDVIRAALSEVEGYQRVEIRSVGDALVPGTTAADLVHLLAELIENGLSFSPPGRPVEVYGRQTRNGYVLAVLDHGIGMTDAEVELANRRLAGEESYTIAPSRYLGHYVAGSLAARIGVSVRLDESPTGGIAAKVVIPPAVLAEIPTMAALAPPAEAPAPTGPPELATPAPAPALAPSAPPTRPAGPVPSPVAEATTEHGLRKRIRRGAAVTPAPTPSDRAPLDDDEVWTRTEPAAAEAPVLDGATPAPATPEPAPIAARAPMAPPVVPTVDLPPSWLTEAAGLTPPATSTAAAAPAAPVSTDATPPAPPWLPDPAAPAPSWTPAPAPTSAPTAPTVPIDGTGTTENGLRKRVPGDQLAASTLTPMIRRASIPADGSPGPAPAGPNGAPATGSRADDLFSLLSSFESGVRRGRDDLARVGTDGADEHPTDPGAPAGPTDQEV